MLVTMVDRRKKKKKKHWLKRPNAIPQKRKLHQSINDSKSHIWNSFILFFYIHPHVPVNIITISFFSSFLFQYFRFSSRKSQSQQKLSIKITYIAVQFRSEKLSFYQPRLT